MPLVKLWSRDSLHIDLEIRQKRHVFERKRQGKQRTMQNQTILNVFCNRSTSIYFINNLKKGVN